MKLKDESLSYLELIQVYKVAPKIAHFCIPYNFFGHSFRLLKGNKYL